MGKPVSVRAHYRNDAAFLLRLETAIQKDEKQPQRWRNETSELIRKLAIRLLEASKQEGRRAPA